MYRVLIADDEAEVVELVKLYLEKDGFQVFAAADGMTALGTVETEKLVSNLSLFPRARRDLSLIHVRKLTPHPRCQKT